MLLSSHPSTDIFSGTDIPFSPRYLRAPSASWSSPANSAVIAGLSLILAGVISQFASSKPDGLEWSLLNISNSVVEQTQSVVYTVSEALQAKTAILANMPFTSGSIAGLFAVAALMYLTCSNLCKAEENA